MKIKKGAEIIALPAAFTLHTGKDHWEGRCHVVGGLVAKEHDENQLLRISVSSGDHSPGDLATRRLQRDPPTENDVGNAIERATVSAKRIAVAPSLSYRLATGLSAPAPRTGLERSDFVLWRNATGAPSTAF